MGTHNRRSVGSYFFTGTAVFLILLLSSCTKYGGSTGGAAMESCRGLRELGYNPPYTEQDVASIKALGLEHCIK